MIENKFNDINNDNFIYFCIKITFVILILFNLIKFYWNRRRLYLCALKFSGPVALPIIGNVLHFAGKTEDLLNKLYGIVCAYTSPCRLWIGHQLTVLVYEPEDLEVILTDTVNIKKGDTYRFMEPFLGQGLISNSGSLWKSHRKLISPTFTSKTLRYYVESFNAQSKIFVEKLRPIADRHEIVDIIHPLSLCTIDMVLSTIFGADVGAQYHKADEFVEHVELAYKMVFERMFKGWLHIDPIFRFSSCYRNTMKAQKVIHNFADQLIVAVKHELNCKYKDGIIDDANARTTLEHLLVINQKGNDFFTDEELRDETYTIFTASQDTIATTSAFILLMLAMHPEIQEKVHKEILEIINDSKDVYIEWEKYSEFTYLEMVIKEALRLFPIGPTIMRQVIQDIKLKNNIIIPKGAGIMIVMYRTHRLPKYWSDPEKFIPERFLPELCNTRNPFSYAPFSAGPRSCIGTLYKMSQQKCIILFLIGVLFALVLAPRYAMLALKTIVIHAVRSFKLSCDQKYQDLKLTCDISTRSLNGYKMKLELRK